jgi:hypothetical protein
MTQCDARTFEIVLNFRSFIQAINIEPYPLSAFRNEIRRMRALLPAKVSIVVTKQILIFSHSRGLTERG